MSFDKIKELRVSGSNIYKFDDYALYMISPKKMTYGISPVLDKIIDKEYSFHQCKRDGGGITDDYIYKIFQQENTYMFFVTKTITNNKNIWEDEKLDSSLIKKLEQLEFNKENVYYLRLLITKQLNKLGVKSMAPGFNKSSFFEKVFNTRKQQVIDKINEVNEVKNQSGSGIVNKLISDEYLISFMFVEKKNDNDYYVRVRCTSDIIDFDEEHTESNPKPEYKFPWSTYFLYVLLKSFGNKSINLYNHASTDSVTYYHKRFLFNLGKKDCSEDDEIYNNSVLIPFNIIKGPNEENRKLFTELLKSLPNDYKTSYGYKMKVCDIQYKENIAKINDIGEYLTMKWNEAFGGKHVNISSKKILYPRSAFKTKKSISKARSLSPIQRSKSSSKKSKNSSKKSKSSSKNSRNSSKKTKKISYRRSL